MKSSDALFEQIAAFEAQGERQQAQALRQKLLQKAEAANDAEFRCIIEKLIKEQTVVNGVADAENKEPYYRRLADTAEQRVGSTDAIAALAKRQLARIFVIQGCYEEAVAIVEKALPVLSARFGEDSFEVREAMDSAIGWCKFYDPAKARAWVEREWLEHPLCTHLQPVESYVQSKGAETWREEGNTRPEVRVYVRGSLDLHSIREKLKLDACVENYEVPPGPHSWCLSGFICRIHRHLIVGDCDSRQDRLTIPAPCSQASQSREGGCP